jgi:hypothetical protein
MQDDGGVGLVASVLGVLEERARQAQVCAEELREQVEKLTVELAAAEAVLARRLIAVEEATEAFAAPVAEAERPSPQPVPARPPVPGTIVPVWHDGLSVQVLAPDYQRLIAVLEADAGAGGAGLRAREIAEALGLEPVPARVEGVRSKAKRLTEREWIAEPVPGRFTLRARTS